MRALLAALLITPALGGCILSPGGPAQGEPGDGSVPQWTLVDLDGGTHGTDTAQGNVTVLFFMASWCGTCKTKTGMLADVHAAHAEEPVTFITVSWDPSDDASDLSSWKDRYDQPWPHAVDEGSRVSQTFDITVQSSFVVLGPDGSVHRKWSYPGPDRTGLESAIADVLPAA